MSDEDRHKDTLSDVEGGVEPEIGEVEDFSWLESALEKIRIRSTTWVDSVQPSEGCLISLELWVDLGRVQEPSLFHPQQNEETAEK